MKKLFFIIIVLLISLTVKALPDEGMWLLPLIEKLNMGKMTELGLKLSAEDIYNLNNGGLTDAVVSMGRGFCTAEIVSSQGLMLTNYHCGLDYIQSHSSLEHDYHQDGFWAKSLKEELPNQGLYVRFLVSIEDVTGRVLENVTGDMTENERNQEINKAIQTITVEATAGTHYSSSVSSFYGGNNFYLLVYESYNDVRLVGAPPAALGKYGDDTDNWEWPRHTADFSVFRVYMGPDGKPAEYSEDNVPLKPKHYLPVSIKGIQEDDFAMVLGYPGGTSRYMTSYEVEELLEITHPNIIKIRGALQEAWMEDMMADPVIRMQYASKYQGVSNYWKNSIGQKAALEKLNVKGEKEELEKRFTDWVNARNRRKQQYGDALNLIRTSIEGRAKNLYVEQYIRECFRAGTELITIAGSTSRILNAISSGNSKTRENINILMNAAEDIYKDYSAPTDRKSIIAMFSIYKADIPSEYWPAFMFTIDKEYNGSVEEFVDYMFRNSIFTSLEKLRSFTDNPDAEKLASDPAMVCYQDIRDLTLKAVGEEGDFNTNLARGRRLYIAGLREMDPDVVRYPDANSTMRLTYGSVLSYEPRDAVIYKYYTTMTGVLEKYVKDDYEFDLPEDYMILFREKQFGRYADPKGYMPVCFLTNNDITGGNSGSPVINGNGELIGLAFDGNWEAMSGDISFDPALQRCICVDIRYVLWVMDIYAGARNLVDEMTIRR